MTLEQPDQAGWRALASTLEGYVARDGLQPLAEGKTDENGRLTFSGLDNKRILGESHDLSRLCPFPVVCERFGLPDL